MFDAIHAGGRGPVDQAVMKMLIGALEDYWGKFGVLPSPIRVISDVPAVQLRAVAEAQANYEGAADPWAGVMALPDGGQTTIPYPLTPPRAESPPAEHSASAREIAKDLAGHQQRKKHKGATPKVSPTVSVEKRS